jgi:SARP family transcriptional regulator, regulator of embCAB operon
VPDAAEPPRVQLCGTFAMEVRARRVDTALPGRQGRLLVARLALSPQQPVPRDTLIDALWGESPPPAAAAALSVLVSKVRAAVGPEVLRGRSELTLTLPLPAYVDADVAPAALHAAESAIAAGDWRRAWSPALTARAIARRPFLPEAGTPWADGWRRRLADVYARALECYGSACLRLGGAELPGAERAARELLEVAPLRETGHALLMEALAARGNVAEALEAYGELRVLLREALGVDPSSALQDTYARLLG